MSRPESPEGYGVHRYQAGDEGNAIDGKELVYYTGLHEPKTTVRQGQRL
jgi:hypothetical protein